MSIEILEYQYRMGALSIKNLVEMVEQQQITEEQFHDITRKNYKGFIKNHKMELEKTKGEN